MKKKSNLNLTNTDIREFIYFLYLSTGSKLCIIKTIFYKKTQIISFFFLPK